MASLVSDSWPLIPVPGSPHNNRTRGFDPVELLVRVMAAEKKLPWHRGFCRHPGRSQKSLDREARREEVRSRIGLLPLRVELPDQVYLVDDVFTTGATADHCAGLLKAAGVRKVILLAAAGP